MKRETERERAFQILREAWENFVRYYDQRCKYYSRDVESQRARDLHWICWSEFDMLMQIARFFYHHRSQRELENVEVHINVNVSPTMFDDYSFTEALKAARESVGRTPKPDFILAFEDDVGPFILCAESKCLRYRQWFRLENLCKDRDKLLALRSHGVCTDVAYFLLDDYFFIKNERLSRRIKAELEEYEQQDGIHTFYHTSRAKIPD